MTLDKTPASIRTMFNMIANKYDFVNNVMSFGTQNHVKNRAIKILDIKPHDNVIDLCCGTGDLSGIIKKTSPHACITGIDFSEKMLSVAKEKYTDICFMQGDVTNLPYADNSFDFAVMGFGLRNILNAEKGSRVAGDALYYLSRDWTNRNFKYEQDHLHPFDRFDGSKPVSVSMEDWRRWRGNRNRLPNLQLLEGRSNGSKNDMRLIDYYNDMNDEQKAEFRKQAIIPDGVSLELEHFDEFYEKRKAVLT